MCLDTPRRATVGTRTWALVGTPSIDGGVRPHAAATTTDGGVSHRG
ncbi:hypothetical protein [Halovivax ruber]|nr:hypothetical protein [Halovivax ruber]